ncbi:MAG TPA: pectin acetylesterase-family hydrolase [Thermoanaerobaculia bacterium]|nr:pectin acetylesterase-family hydrolase [Thermoanaerobaculia bacterium]
MIRTITATFLTLIATAVSAATLDKTVTCGRPGEAGGLGAGTDMQRVVIDSRRYPAALCNDSTPGIFYASRYTREEDRDKWVIFLQGGGGCGSGQECANRWCSAGTNFGMDKMSTSLSKPGINGTGIFDRRESNRFGTWNHVLIYYCSSDNWAGNKLNRLSASNSSGTAVDFDIHFRGSKIIEAVVDTLRKTSGGRVRSVKAGLSTTPLLPDLDEATEVLFGGSSAGGGGVRNNTDKLGGILRANNIRCSGTSACPLIYRAAVDASFGPDSSKLDFSTSSFCASDPRQCSYEGVFNTRYISTVVDTWGSERDQSCMAWHQTNAPGTEWRCSDGEHLFAHHLSSELFARQDLQDQLISGNFVEAGLGSALNFGRLMESDLRNFPTIFSRAEEGPTSAGGRPVAVFGPQCGDHESFTSNRAFFNVKVTQNAVPYSFHDVLWNWWSGASPQVVIRSFTGKAGPALECP